MDFSPRPSIPYTPGKPGDTVVVGCWELGAQKGARGSHVPARVCLLLHCTGGFEFQVRGDRRSTRGHHTATCQFLDPALPAGGRLQAPLAELAEARVGGHCHHKGLAGEAGEGWAGSRRMCTAGVGGKVLGSAGGDTAGTMGQQRRGPVTCCFGGTERELSECLGRARMRTWVSSFSVSAPASIALPWVDSDHVTLCPNPFLGDALSLALKTLPDLA